MNDSRIFRGEQIYTKLDLNFRLGLVLTAEVREVGMTRKGNTDSKLDSRSYPWYDLLSPVVNLLVSYIL
jgi:hypothetical protein